MFNSFSEAVSLSITKETEVFEEGKQSLDIIHHVTFLACSSFLYSLYKNNKVLTWKWCKHIGCRGEYLFLRETK
jgi:hypothetical protein